jgi:hypothetical protein
VFCGAVGLFVGGVLLALLERIPGLVAALLIASGAIAIGFSPNMANAQRQLAEHSWVPSSWKNARPLTARLWGVGVTIIGVLWFLNERT